MRVATVYYHGSLSIGEGAVLLAASVGMHESGVADVKILIIV